MCVMPEPFRRDSILLAAILAMMSLSACTASSNDTRDDGFDQADDDVSDDDTSGSAGDPMEVTVTLQALGATHVYGPPNAYEPNIQRVLPSDEGACAESWLLRVGGSDYHGNLIFPGPLALGTSTNMSMEWAGYEFNHIPVVFSDTVTGIPYGLWGGTATVGAVEKQSVRIEFAGATVCELEEFDTAATTPILGCTEGQSGSVTYDTVGNRTLEIGVGCFYPVEVPAGAEGSGWCMPDDNTADHPDCP